MGLYQSKLGLGVAALVLHVLVAMVLPSQIMALGFILAWWSTNELVKKGVRFKRVPRVFGYSFYPAHVLILRLLSGG